MDTPLNLDVLDVEGMTEDEAYLTGHETLDAVERLQRARLNEEG